MIVVDAYGLFSGILRKTFQETLLIPVHVFARGNQKAIINEGFYMYLNKVHNINSEEKVAFTNGRNAYYLHCTHGMQDQ